MNIETIYACLREKITELKLQKRKKLRVKLLQADPTRRKFWRFLRQQTKSVGKISALMDNNKMVFEQKEVEKVVMGHFSTRFEGKLDPIYPSHAENLSLDDSRFPQDVHTAKEDSLKYESEVCSPYTFAELQELLQDLPHKKASGCDSISNEMIKNTSQQFQQYLLIFLNKIFEEGEVKEWLV